MSTGPSSEGPLRLFATAAKGTEGVLRDELREQGVRGVRADRGGVHFTGDLVTALGVCLWSRIAIRVLVELDRFPCPHEDALYEGVVSLDWAAWLDAKRTLAVRAASRGSALTHTQFIAQRTKDAVVDRVRNATGARPSVDRDAPDLLLFVHLVDDQATLYADAAGASLHARGYRPRDSSQTAPLKETLAAAILRLSGWDRTSPLCDPMCGTGTLGVEAALWAAGAPANAGRARFGVEGWRVATEVDRAAFRVLRDEARAAAAEARGRDVVEVRVRDVDPRAIAMTEEAARTAGVRLRVERGPVAELRVDDAPGWLITNPPYGERLALGDAARDLGRVIRARGERPSAVLAGVPAIMDAIGTPLRAHELHNGDLSCRLLSYGRLTAPSKGPRRPS